MIPRLLEIADAIDNECKANVGPLLRDALQGEAPHSGGVEEVKRYFGEHVAAVSRQVAPSVFAIDSMAPGFADWLNHTGFGDDKLMLLALLEVSRAMGAYRRPSGERKRPDFIPPPAHL